MKKAIILSSAAQPGGPYSHVVLANGFVFISGQRPVHPETGIIPESFRQQAQQCLENIKTILQEVGSSLEEVVKINAYLSDVAQFAEFNQVYRTFFTHDYPARTTIGCELRGVLVEIDCIAVTPA